MGPCSEPVRSPGLLGPEVGAGAGAGAGERAGAGASGGGGEGMKGGGGGVREAISSNSPSMGAPVAVAHTRV
jgi:hypothetical protein